MQDMADILISHLQSAPDLFAYDDCSNITSLCNSKLFIVGSICKISAVNVSTQSGSSKSISQKGDAYVFGESYFCPHQFINILCAFDVERNPAIVVSTVSSSDGHKLGYDLF